MGRVQAYCRGLNAAGSASFRLSVARLRSAFASAAGIRSAIENLATHPLIGRRVEGDLRELVISYGATGYIALYRFDIQRDQVRVLALRHQREIGYLP